MHRFHGRLLIVGILTTCLSACGGSDGADGAQGPQGPAGTNGGLSALIAVVPEAAGVNCTYGGSRVDSGLDSNANSALDTAEISSTQYVCNGAAGADGTPGAPGTPGADGTATNSLVATTTEPPGANCPAGGRRFSAGLDSNDNGVLDSAEINSSGYICNGAAGATGASGINSLTAMVTESPGANCANGGVRLTTGGDADANGTLDPSEVSTTRFVCNGANGTNGSNGSNGANGLTTLIRTDPESAGANCSYGGTRISAGPDTNNNTILDSGEITASAFACNGAPGPGVTWVSVSGTAVQAAGNHGYLINNATTEVVVTLPTSPAFGDIIQVNGTGIGGWRIEQNTGQHIVTQGLAGPLSQSWLARGVTGDWTMVTMSTNGRRQAAGIYNGTIYYSSDYGATWRASNAPARYWTIMTSSADGLRIYATEQNGTWASSDGGATWGQLTVPWGAGFPRIATSADGTRLIVEKYGEPLHLSTDSGTTWTNVEQARPWMGVASSATGQTLVAVASLGNQIYISNDYGANWTTTGRSENWRTVSCSQDCAHMLASADTGRLYVSHDTGVTWTQTAYFGGWYGLAVSATGRRMAAADSSNALIVSEDGGATWTAHADVTNAVSVAASADGLRLTATTMGTQLKVSNRDPLDATVVGTGGHIIGGQYSGATLVYSGGGQFVMTQVVGLLDAR